MVHENPPLFTQQQLLVILLGTQASPLGCDLVVDVGLGGYASGNPILGFHHSPPLYPSHSFAICKEGAARLILLLCLVYSGWLSLCLSARWHFKISNFDATFQVSVSEDIGPPDICVG